MRDQSAGGDKENPGLPRLALTTPAYFLRSWQPLQFLNRVSDEKGKVCEILHFLIPPCSKIAFKKIRNLIQSLHKSFLSEIGSDSIGSGFEKPRLILLIDTYNAASTERSQNYASDAVLLARPVVCLWRDCLGR
jgi:hypothetical protein